MLIYESITNDGWNGRTTSGSEVPEGTYFYLISIEVDNCGVIKKESFRGSLMLLR